MDTDDLVGRIDAEVKAELEVLDKAANLPLEGEAVAVVHRRKVIVLE